MSKIIVLFLKFGFFLASSLFAGDVTKIDNVEKPLFYGTWYHVHPMSDGNILKYQPMKSDSPYLVLTRLECDNYGFKYTTMIYYKTSNKLVTYYRTPHHEHYARETFSIKNTGSKSKWKIYTITTNDTYDYRRIGEGEQGIDEAIFVNEEENKMFTLRLSGIKGPIYTINPDALWNNGRVVRKKWYRHISQAL